MIGLANTNLLSRTKVQLWTPANTVVSYSNTSRNTWGQTGVITVVINDQNGDAMRITQQPTATHTFGNLSAFTQINNNTWQATYSSSSVGTTDIEVFYAGVSVSTQTITYTVELFVQIASITGDKNTYSSQSWSVPSQYRDYEGYYVLSAKYDSSFTRSLNIQATSWDQTNSNTDSGSPNWQPSWTSIVSPPNPNGRRFTKSNDGSIAYLPITPGLTGTAWLRDYDFSINSSISFSYSGTNMDVKLYLHIIGE